MKANYAAWHIDSSKFSKSLSDDEKLIFFARYAVLAPSGHNTQPWRFSVKDGKLLLHADNNRILPYSGIQANEPYVSLGACLQTLQLAARGFGYDVSVHYALDKTAVASVTLGREVTAEPSLLDAITHRVSNRFKFSEAPLPPDVTKLLSREALPNATVLLLENNKDRQFVAEQTESATLRVFKDKDFRLELSKWVRNNRTRQHDGMPGAVQGIPTPPSMLAKHIIRRLDISKDQSKKDVSRVLNASALAIVTVKDSSAASLLDGGRLYAQICILAQQAGVASAGVGTAVIEPLAREAVAKHFALQGQPIAIIRLGKALKPAPHAPRWPLHQVLD